MQKRTQKSTKADAKTTLTRPVPKKPSMSTPFGEYIAELDNIDKGLRYSDEFGSILILSLVEEIGEMARAYLAQHGRKQTNLAAQADETYQQELGDILVSILRFARIKNINLHERVSYSLAKIAKRRNAPKPASQRSSTSPPKQNTKTAPQKNPSKTSIQKKPLKQQK